MGENINQGISNGSAEFVVGECALSGHLADGVRVER
jgi:hypothetical protein